MRTARLLLALFCFAAVALRAHDPGLSSATLWFQGDQVKATLTFAPADIDALLPMDLDRDGSVSESEFEETRPVLEGFVREGVQVTFDGEPAGATEVSIERTEDKRGNNIEIQLRFPVRSEASLLRLRNRLLRDLPAGHRHYILLFDEGANLAGEALLDRANDVFEVPLAHSANEAEARSFGDFFSLGVEHILGGYDHLLFLFALFAGGIGLASAAKIITSFTVAHSITLALATYEVIQLSPAIVEPLIALSIAYVGAENILRRNVERRWLVTFVFGLIHGLGFASVLRELGIGTAAGSTLLPLMGFNLGVEAGQIGIAVVALPLIWGLTQRPQFAWYFRPASSLAVTAMGAYWFVERVVARG
jgi:hypothetical protein